ncbi:MAG: DUF11 domain-containing protein [Rhodanobacteraceae bacterium]|jgi:uncharacterized repeat protein (TIGR01451 family)|nr:DUF11 domain-containing protein [Rhodanobacteraceae bacterium]
MIKNNPRKCALLLAAGLAATLAAAPALAGTLHVAASAGGTPQPRAAAGEFGFAVSNEGAGQLDGVRIVSDRAHAVSCAASTAQGYAFAGAGSLRAGDSVQCIGRPSAQARGRTASLTVVAREANGTVRSRQVSFAQPSALTPAQGVVVLSAGAVHNDANGDGVLDAGETISYHYSVLNLGTLALSGLGVTDIGGSATCPNTALAVGASMVCTQTYTISAADDAAGMVMNEVDVGGSDANGGAVLAGDLVLSMDRGGNAGIRVFKSPLLLDDADASGYASAGDRLRYTFVLKNSNAQMLAAVNLVEPDPSRIDTPITCAPMTLAGQPFAGLGSGVLQSNDVVLCQAEHTVTAAEAGAGSADNLAEASGQPAVGGVVSGSGASAVVIPTAANVVVAKALTGESGSRPGIAEPGETLTYTLTLSNSGGAAAFNVGLVDPLDPNTLFVSASDGGVHAGGAITWSGLTVPAGGSVSLSVVVTVADPLPAGAMRIANLAYVPGTTPPDCAATPLPAGCAITPTVGAIAIAKALTGESGSQPGIAEPGETLTYAITLTNTGGSAVTGYGVSDPLDPHVAFVSADHGGAYAAGVVSWSNLTIPAGGSLVLTVVVTVDDPLPFGLTRIANVAHASGTPAPDCSLVPLPAACVVTPVAAPPQLQVSKSVGASTVAPGGSATYTITVVNVGTVTANNVVIDDPLPAGIASFAWSCAALDGATCAAASGNGALHETIPALPVGGRLVYTVVAQIAAGASGSILNTVAVTPSSATVCMPANLPGPCSASAPIAVTPPQDPRPVPADDRFALLLLGLALAAATWRMLR